MNPGKPARIKRMQFVLLAFLLAAGIVNFLDRGSLSIANATIRGELGLSATQIGVLLSAFSFSYGLAQLPTGLLVDRFGPRLILGIGMAFWSAAQMLTGFVGSFSQFIVMRIGLGIGEAPFFASGVKAVNDWFAVKERGLPMGVVNASTTLGQAFAPPILALTMVALGWRGMFVIIGGIGIALAIAWYVVYRDRNQFRTDATENTWLPPQSTGTHPSFAEWRRLFRQRTVWGMMLGFSGVNYTAWLYLAWLPGYLQAERHLSLTNTGWVAMVPFLFGSVGMLLSGYLVDLLVRRGVGLLWSRKLLICCGLVASAAFTYFVTRAGSTTAAVAMISGALFCVHIAGTAAWGLVQVATPPRMVASVSTIQNFGSFVCASFAPIVTGWVVDTTRSFNLALTICACVTLAGAASYLFIVKREIRESDVQVPPEPQVAI